MVTWALLIFQGESSIRMEFHNIGDVSEFIRDYGKMFGEDTRFVFMNNSGPEVEVIKKYHINDEEVPLPDGF